jgi:hypothetical protein
LEKAGPFSAKTEEKSLAAFFPQTARMMNAAEPVPATASRVPAAGPDAFALFLFAVKDWQQSDFANTAALFEQFQRSQSAGAYAWVNDYKPVAEKFLADYRVYADWKNQAQNFKSRDQITAAVTALRTAQGKLQLRGRLNEAFKDEETKLVRQLEEKK